jgi:hypothetical protein
MLTIRASRRAAPADGSPVHKKPSHRIVLDATSPEALTARTEEADRHALITLVVTRLRALRLLGIIVSAVSIAAAIVAAEEVFRVRTANGGYGRTTDTDTMKIISTVFTVLCLVCAVIEEQMRWRLRRLQRTVLPTVSYWDTRLPAFAALDLAMTAVHTPMYCYGTFISVLPTTQVTVTYDYDGILSVFMFYRFAKLVLLVLMEATGFETATARFVQRTTRVRFDAHFAFRSLLHANPILASLCIYASAVFVLTYVMRVAEHPVGGYLGSSSLGAGYNCFWLIVITSLTVGYGDLYPLTHFGRLTSTVAAVLGICIVALLVNAVSDATRFIPAESRSLGELHLRRLAVAREKLARRVVGNAMLFWMNRVRAARGSGARAAAGAAALAAADAASPDPTSVRVHPEAALASSAAPATDSSVRTWAPLGPPARGPTVRLANSLAPWASHCKWWIDAHRCTETTDEVKRDVDELKDALKSLHGKIDALVRAAGVEGAVRSKRGASVRSEASSPS